MGATSIEWATHTFNPWRGCTRVSEACRNCYAETWSKRNPLVLGVWGPNGTRVVAAEAQWREPLKWQRQAEKDLRFWHERPYTPKPVRPRVFCASLADVFEDWPGVMVDAQGRSLWATGPDGEDGTTEPTGTPLTMDRVRFRLWRLINRTPHLDWLLLTKRPENILRMGPAVWCHPATAGGPRWPRNVWVGTTVEDQEQADRRIPELLRVPAAVRFLSCEPLLGPVDLGRFLCCHWCRTEGEPLRAENGETYHMRGNTPMRCPTDSRGPAVSNLHWCIVGGESGPGARPMNLEWARSLVSQCKAAGVACFVKQLGSEWAKGESTKHVRLDGKGGELDEWPLDLRVREFPTTEAA